MNTDTQGGTHTHKSLGGQAGKILAYMQRGNRIDAMKALTMFRCFRLAARVWELRGLGYDIKTREVANENGGYHAEYWMEQGKAVANG